MNSTIQWLNHHAVHSTILYVSTFWKTRARLTSMELVQSSSNLNMCQAVQKKNCHFCIINTSFLFSHWRMEFEPQIYPNIDPCLMFLHGRSLTFCLCMMQISDLVFSGPDDQYFATSSADGVLHLWSKDSLEHLQFQVLEQVITKKTFCCISPSLISCLSK